MIAGPVLFIALPLAWHAWRHWREDGGWRTWLPVAGPMLGMGIYLLWMHLAVGDALAGFRAQRVFIAHSSVGDLLDIAGFLAAFVHVAPGHAYLTSPLDRLTFLWFLLGMGLLLRDWRREAPLLLYGLPLGLVPAMTVKFMAYNRYLLVVFPVFYATGWLLERKPGWGWVVLPASGGLQVLLFLRHINHFWAG